VAEEQGGVAEHLNEWGMRRRTETELAIGHSKTTFINGRCVRYVSSTDPSRKLIFLYEDNGAFHCDAIDLKEGVRLRVEVVRDWQLDLDEPSLKMSAKFYSPGGQVLIESEFRVLDSEWVHERWRTSQGATGDNFWQKTEL